MYRVILFSNKVLFFDLKLFSNYVGDSTNQLLEANFTISFKYLNGSGTCFT